MSFTFAKAVKQQEKLRLALDGPAGSGKTWTALIIATELAARDGGRVAVIDSERSSARKYASDFDFDHLTLPDWSPHTYMAAVRAAVESGYTVIIIDSFSHAWEGVLELKDNATARSRSKNSYTEGWREATPVHNELVDTVLRADAHIIATLRTKTEYVIEDGSPKKIGMKPIQRDGVDFEFDVVGDMTSENSMVISKTRCSALTGQVIRKPDKRIAETLWAWLNDGEAPPEKASPEFLADLKARVKALPQPWRKECGDAIAERVAWHPEDILVSQQEDALKIVAEFKQLADDDDHPEPPAPGSAPADPSPPGDGGGAQTSPPVGDEPPGSSQNNAPAKPGQGSVAAEGPEEEHASGPDAALNRDGITVRALAKLADQAFPLTKDDAPPRRLTWAKKRLRYTVTSALTNGRTVHLDELTPEEAVKLWGRLRDITEGRTRWSIVAEGLQVATGEGEPRTLPWVDPDDHARTEEAA